VNSVKANPTCRLTTFDLVWGCTVFLFVGLGIGACLIPRPLNLDEVHKWAYNKSQWWLHTRWMGTPIQKSPLDLWTYSELLYETKPDVLIETGTFVGGSSLYCASIFDLLGHGRVITIDIEKHPNLPQHPRITYLRGSSTSDEILRQVKAAIRPGETVMVVLDSDHRKAHVLRELTAYSPLVSPGNYLVAEDGDINGHPVYPEFGPGPYEAVSEFLASNGDFAPDKTREKYGITFFPNGWLKRLR